MWYLGGKHKQSKAIVQHVSELGVPSSYHEPFCGSLSSAMRVSRCFPESPVVVSDAHPQLIRFWGAAQAGFDPPEHVSEETYAYYNKHRPNDPMTGYIGFACSFGGKYFGGAARTNGVIKSSWKGTMEKIHWLRTHNVRIVCCPYWDHPIGDSDSLYYLDPPYVDRTPQSREVPPFDRSHFVTWAENLPGKVVASEFVNDRNWEVLHNWGDTVVRHLNAKPADGTVELLMRVK